MVDELKKCIACDESISVNAKLCKHCKTLQNDARFLGSPSSIEKSRNPRSPWLLGSITFATVVLAAFASYVWINQGLPQATEVLPVSPAVASDSGNDQSEPTSQSQPQPAQTTAMPDVIVSDTYMGEYDPQGSGVWGYGAEVKFVAGELPGCDNPYADIDFLGKSMNCGTKESNFGGTSIKGPKLGPNGQQQFHIWIPSIPGNGPAAEGRRLEVVNAYCG